MSNDFMTPEWREKRAEMIALIDAHTLMKDCYVLNNEQLADLLDFANIQGEMTYFDGYEVIFGFDQFGQDFLAIKSLVLGDLHFAMLAN